MVAIKPNGNPTLPKLWQWTTVHIGNNNMRIILSSSNEAIIFQLPHVQTLTVSMSVMDMTNDYQIEIITWNHMFITIRLENLELTAVYKLFLLDRNSLYPNWSKNLLRNYTKKCSHNECNSLTS